MTEPLLALSGIVKSYPGCLANDRVSLGVGRNEIHALLGENGAGKSTLVKIIYGVTEPDEGEINWCGQPVSITNPAGARKLGIGMVFQHFSLFEALTVAENIALGLDHKLDDLKAKIRALSASYGMPVDPDRTVHDLSVGERQRVEILRCLLQNPKLLIMDEPTSVLTPGEAETLFVTLRRLASEGCSILYISHKLEEVRALCDRATVMRLGRVVAECDPKAKTAKELAEIMVNAEIKEPHRKVPLAEGRPVRFAVNALTLRSPHIFGTHLDRIEFSVGEGEILGIAGIAGNGQAELMEALTGEVLSPKPETILLDGGAIGHLGPGARREKGGCFVPEDRNGHGAVTSMTLAENAFLSGYLRASLSRFGLIDRRKTRDFAEVVIRRFDVRTSGAQAEARSLSGGNLQKFLIGREILQQPRLLVINQPSWGVDAGAAAAIHEAIIRLAEEGAAVVIISQDLDELFVLADRIAVIAGGKLSEPVPVAQASIGSIGLKMGGTVHA